MSLKEKSDGVKSQVQKKIGVPVMYKDIAYAKQSQRQKLDIYLPPEAKTPFPVILWMHPGGFNSGDKTWFVEDIKEIALQRNYAIVSINYRLTPEAIFPAQIYDAKAAVRWIRANASKYGFHPEKVVAAGVSAGGYLAALLGTSAGIKELEDLSMGNESQPSHVNAVVDLYGPIDFLKKEEHLRKLGYEMGRCGMDMPEAQLIGCCIEEAPDKCRMANPMTYINPKCPPFYIQHGTADKNIPYLQSVELAEALRAVIGQDKVHLELVPDAGHFDMIHLSAKYVNKIFNFLDAHLR